MIELREFEDDDWTQLWPFVSDIIRRGDTYCYDPHQTEDEARRRWVVAPPGRVVVAAERDSIVGTSNMYANQQGPGSHIASGNFMVPAEARQRGVGFALGQDLLAWARARGFAGVQFNAVAESNAPAVSLYRKLGFELVGTVPGAFHHPVYGFVGLHVMFHDLGNMRG